MRRPAKLREWETEPVDTGGPTKRHIEAFTALAQKVIEQSPAFKAAINEDAKSSAVVASKPKPKPKKDFDYKIQQEPISRQLDRYEKSQSL